MHICKILTEPSIFVRFLEVDVFQHRSALVVLVVVVVVYAAAAAVLLMLLLL